MKTLAEFRAVSSPTMAIEACEICSKIPKRCSRFEKGGDVENDDIPPEAERLVPYLGPVSGHRGEIKRCPTCSRTYWYDHEYEFIVGGSEDTWAYVRLEPEELFRGEWFIRHRLEPRTLGITDVEAQPWFGHHAFVRLDGVWCALDDDNATTMTIATLDDMARLAVIDPPLGLDDPENAKRYSRLVDRMTSPRFQSSMFFSTLPWKHDRDCNDEERAQIKDLEAASRVERESAVKLDDRVIVTKWGISERRLICRMLTVFPSGEVRREDAVIGENVPVK
ncbi:MAG: hypothetical protein M4D80_00380 [Myxococcota bacterium]|nr:hypothetical protein [Deltaproteobacteria bacterium]MDQ3333608.1 hypothetical protein [Myxococcota bacterium]